MNLCAVNSTCLTVVEISLYLFLCFVMDVGPSFPLSPQSELFRCSLDPKHSASRIFIFKL